MSEDAACTPLFVDHAEALGGAEVSLLLALQHLDRARFRPALACCSGPLAERAAALGVSIYPVPLLPLRRSSLAPWRWFAGARALARAARQADANVLVANTVRAAFYAAPAARLAGLPFVWHMRDFWLSEAGPRREPCPAGAAAPHWACSACRRDAASPGLWADALGKRALIAAAAAVVANSQATAAHLPHAGKVQVVYNGVEVGAYDPEQDGASFRRRWGIPLTAPLVGMVGRLRPWKGQEAFLRLAARVAAAVPEARLAVIGGALFAAPGDYPAELRRLAAELGLGERVVFTGHLDDVRPALAALDLYVHPGAPEPFGLAALEAMAMARPVLGFAHGALPEVVGEEAGRLVSPGDEEALAAAALELLAQPAVRRALGRAGRARALHLFTAERMAEELGAVLAEAAGLA